MALGKLREALSGVIGCLVGPGGAGAISAAGVAAAGLRAGRVGAAGAGALGVGASGVGAADVAAAGQHGGDLEWGQGLGAGASRAVAGPSRGDVGRAPLLQYGVQAAGGTM